MRQGDLISFFLEIGVMLAVALIFGQVTRKLGQPTVIGELLGGVVLGPTVFGAVAPHAQAWLFPAAGQAALARDAVIEIGMLFFLFVAGLEVDLRQVRRRGVGVALTSALGILVPFALGFASVLALPGLWGPHPQQETLIFPLFVGTALSISALPVIARILLDLDLMRREIGVVVMTAATISDVIGWLLFAVILGALVPGHTHGPWVTLGLLAAVTVVVGGLNHWLGRPAMRWIQTSLAWPSGLIGATTVVILLAAVFVESVGMHAIFGALLVGVALGQTLDRRERNQAHEVIYQFALSFFAPLYFVSVGLAVDFAAHFDPWLTLFVVVIATVGKLAGAGLGARLGGMAPRAALAVGFGLNARGGMEIILASVALQYEVIDQRVYVALVVMAVVTSMLSSPALERLARPPQPEPGA